MPIALDPAEYVEAFVERRKFKKQDTNPSELQEALVALRREMLVAQVRQCFRDKDVRFIERCINYLENRGASIVDKESKTVTRNPKADRMRQLFPD
jgi:hypothetical protein